HGQGVRWYMPDTFGEVVPHRPSLFAAEMDVTAKPDFRMRGWWSTTSADSYRVEYRWRVRNGLTANSLITMPGDSSIRSVMPPEAKVNDKEFEGVFGKREDGTPNPFMPNLSDHRSAVYAAGAVKKFFREHPAEKIFGIAPDDGLPRDFTPDTVKAN